MHYFTSEGKDIQSLTAIMTEFSTKHRLCPPFLIYSNFHTSKIIIYNNYFKYFFNILYLLILELHFYNKVCQSLAVIVML